jgi:DNA-binding PadR family transcriptional regulator
MEILMHPMYGDMNENNDNGRRDRRFGPRGPRFGGGREHHGEPFGRGRGHSGGGGAERMPGRGGFGPGFGPGFGRHGFGAGPGFGPGFGREGGRRARRGDVRLAILSLLGEGPANGYTLIKTIAERTDGAWRPSPGSVYPTLQQLVDEGLVIASGDEGKSVYDLTDAGRQEAEDKADEIARAWQTTPGLSDPQREFVESLRKSLGVLHMYRQSATEDQVKAATAKIDQLRKDLLQILAD